MPESNKQADRSNSLVKVSRRQLLATTSLGVAGGLAGCTGGDGDGDGDGGGTQGSPGEESVELTWWHQENVPHRIDIYEELNQKFMDEHPNITVRQQAQTWGDIFAKLTSAVNAGNAPDFWFTTPALAMTFQSRGSLVDISDMMSDLDSQYNYFDKTVAQYEYDGGTWGVPNWNKGWNYFYRTDTFGGVSNWPPDNWENWLAGLQSETNADDNQFGFVLAAANTHFGYKSVYNVLALGGGYVFGPDGKIMFNTEETVNALDFYKKAFTGAVPDDATDWSWPGWDRSLREGVCHSSSCYTAPIPWTDREFQQQWDVVKNPSPSGGQWGDQPSRRFVSIDGISVFNEDKLDAIQKWIEFAHRPDIYGWWMRVTNPTLFIPTHEAGWNSDTYWEGKHSQQPLKKMTELQKDLDDMAYPGMRDLHLENDTYVGEALGKIEGNFPLGQIANKLVVDDASPQEAAEWGQSKLEDVTGLGSSQEL